MSDPLSVPFALLVMVAISGGVIAIVGWFSVDFRVHLLGPI